MKITAVDEMMEAKGREKTAAGGKVAVRVSGCCMEGCVGSERVSDGDSSFCSFLFFLHAGINSINSHSTQPASFTHSGLAARCSHFPCSGSSG